MRIVKGFALFISLMLVFLICTFAFWIMLVTQAHYAASRTLYESENARIVSETVAQNLVLAHNYQQPRFFFDPQKWNSLQLKPFSWNGYSISGSLTSTWNPASTNLWFLRAGKTRYASEIQVPVRQLRLEDFALFSDSQQILSTSTLFDGSVFVRNGLLLSKLCRFRDVVYSDVSPAFNASVKRIYKPLLEFPSLLELFPTGWSSGGFKIAAKNPLFWQSDHYELDLDDLEILSSGKDWQIRYKGISLGKAAKLILSFDDNVRVRQTFVEVSHLPAIQQEQSLFVHSSAEISLDSSVQNLQGKTYSLSFCFVSDKSVRISPLLSEVRISASVITFHDLWIEPGGSALNPTEKQSWNSEIRGSAFLMEPQKQQELLQAILNDEKVVWFRGSVGVHGSIHVPPDLIELHFGARRKIHLLIPSFPFVEIVEGREQWL